MKIKLKQRNIRISIALAILAGTVGFNSASFATTFEVKTNVVGACTLTTTDLDFGEYVTTAETVTTAQSKITHTCTAGTSGTIKISQGSTSNGDSTDALPLREMMNDSVNPLAYTISAIPSGVSWGNTTDEGTDFDSDGSATEVDVFGEIATGLPVFAGAYTDTLTVTIQY
ncbi:spore coat U domain-containing protein [Amylibacter sp.]|nr:spore coat U domain-containing protein [Amylibacter sp.]